MDACCSSLDHGRSRRKLFPGKSSRTEGAEKRLRVQSGGIPSFAKCAKDGVSDHSVMFHDTQVPIRIRSRGRISTAPPRCVCRNVRTKRTKRTKFGFGRNFCREGTIFRPTCCVLANVPSVIRRLCHHGPGIAWADIRCVAFLELSKLLNQEDALSAPWLRDEFCSPQAHPCCGKAYRSL